MEETKEWCVYKHTNMINGKVYIGKTCRKPEYRWNDGKGYKGQPHFWHAINKYGWKNFAHEILADGLDEMTAKEMEKSQISLHDSMNPEKGYNQTAGGEGMLGWHHTAESRAKIIQSNHTRGVSVETKKKQSKSHKGLYVGKNNPFYGKQHSDETKRKISIANTGNRHEMTDEIKAKISASRKGKYVGENSHWYGRKHREESKEKIGRASRIYQNLPEVKAIKSERVKGEKNPMYGRVPVTARAVFQYTKDGIFVDRYISASHASRATNISNISIGECCKGKLKSAGGYIWKYDDN